MRLFANANFDFIGQRRKGYILAIVLLVVAVIAMATNEMTRGSWLNYGVDFTGGTLVQVRVAEQTTVAELRPAIAERIPGAEITAFGEGDEYLVRVPQVGETAGGGEAVIEAMRGQFGDDGFEIVRTESVGAKVGGELQARALLAILLSLGATLIYLAFRFEWRFGLAAVIATAHDILLTLGLIAALRLEVGLPMVAAVLTIIGYSLNDTIVIFDRIRENLRATARRSDFSAIINRSINDTLPRTVLTSGTTLVVLISLYLFGGSILRDFSLMLIFGIVLGTYSSVFVAAPALLLIEQKWPGEEVRKRSQVRARATV